MKRQIRPISEMLEDKKLSLLGHVIRREFHHPTYQVTFDTPTTSNIAVPLMIKGPQTTRRNGRPRLNWAEENMSRAWKAINASQEDDLPLQVVGKPYDNGNKLMNEIIVKEAKAYQPPFQGVQEKRLENLTETVSRPSACLRPIGVDRHRRLNPFGQLRLNGLQNIASSGQH